MLTKNTKFFFFIILICIALTFAFGYVAKSSFIGTYDLNKVKNDYNIDDFSVYYEEESQYFDNEITDLKDLQSKSELIVKVKTASKSKLYLQSIETNVKVVEIYSQNLKKGMKKLKNGDEIIIHEPISISYMDDLENIDTIQGYTLLNTNEEYILFLKSPEVVENYQYKNNENISYIPLSTVYSKYSEAETPVLLDMNDLNNGEIKYANIKNSSSIFINKEELDRYKKISKEVFLEYK